MIVHLFFQQIYLKTLFSFIYHLKFLDFYTTSYLKK